MELHVLELLLPVFVILFVYYDAVCGIEFPKDQREVEFPPNVPKQRASSTVPIGHLRPFGEDINHFNPGSSTICWLLWSSIWNQPRDHGFLGPYGFFSGPDSLSHAAMCKAQWEPETEAEGNGSVEIMKFTAISEQKILPELNICCYLGQIKKTTCWSAAFFRPHFFFFFRKRF